MRASQIRIFIFFIYTLSLLQLISFPIRAQRPVDSLRNVVKEGNGSSRIDAIITLAGFRKDVDIKEAESLIRQSLKLSDSLHYNQGKVKSWLILATIASRQNNFTKTDSLINLSMSLANEEDDRHGLTSALLAKGVLNIRKGKYDEAIQNHIEGLAIAELIGDGDLMQTHTMNIGHIKSRLGLPEEADRYFLESLKIAQNFDLKLRIGQVYLALGVSAYQRGDLESCILNYEKALPVFIAEEDLRSAGTVLNNLGYAYYLKKDFSRANDFYDKSLKNRTQLNDLLGVSRIWLNKARISFEQGDFSTAWRLNKRALTIAREIKDTKREMEVLHFMVTIYEKEGKLEEALDALRTYNQLKEVVDKKANQQKVAELSAQFDLERKENELSTTRQEVALLEQKEELLTTRQFLLATVVVVLILMMTLLWLYQRGKVKRARLDEAMYKKQLGHELALKNEELKSHADLLVNQSSLIMSFKEQLAELGERRENLIPSKRIEEIVNYLERRSEDYMTWQQFRLKFEESFPRFTSTLIELVPSLTPNEIDISMLIKINLANKEIAQILNISYDAVKKSIQRMYKKINLNSPEELRVYILKI
ncbi:tetratricopeptide repeat protein [Roseivirga misakiensis]|uniref:HTH luxR-type domain-containing protein n=1 Tax=Roseivirga misakiensis TaxID=1563681 RepID=A0A1E5T764_9BACT|nr:tetratricopeptide repeat protein [Roseivirga misakiensis]OEK07186.1 hypothetical protein BFP71_05910 [Roseivirga misakiensis]